MGNTGRTVSEAYQEALAHVAGLQEEVDDLRAENATLRDQLAAAKESLRAMVENVRRVQDQRDEARALLIPLRALVERMYTDAGAAIERLDRAGLES